MQSTAKKKKTRTEASHRPSRRRDVHSDAWIQDGLVAGFTRIAEGPSSYLIAGSSNTKSFREILFCVFTSGKRNSIFKYPVVRCSSATADEIIHSDNAYVLMELTGSEYTPQNHCGGRPVPPSDIFWSISERISLGMKRSAVECQMIFDSELPLSFLDDGDAVSFACQIEVVLASA